MPTFSKRQTLKQVLFTFFQSKGYVFESDTDTEVIAKLIHHIHSNNNHHSFRELVETVIQQVHIFKCNYLVSGAIRNDVTQSGPKVEPLQPSIYYCFTYPLYHINLHVIKSKQNIKTFTRH